jgi:colicin import membrane protein
VNTRRWGGGQRSWVTSILLHLAVLGAIFGLWYWMAQRPKPVESMGIEARVVTGEALESTRAPPPDPVPEAEPAPVPEQMPEPPPPEPAGPTPEELAAQAAEQARVADERRVAAEREVAERKAAAEKAERDRKEKERKEKERLAREKAEKEKAEKAERERLAQQKAEQERAEKARQQRESELDAQLAAEERRAAARSSAAIAQYAAQIKAHIERRWNKPPSIKVGLECELRVTQVVGGAVTSAKIGRCNGDDAVKQSIEAAALRASPLPSPSDPALFERELALTFRYNGE